MPLDNEHIEIEPFDREYTIEELLPGDLLDGLARTSAAMFASQWAVFTDTGRCHFAFGPWRPDLLEQIETTISRAQPDSEAAIGNSARDTLLIFPIEYEMEIKGYVGIYEDADQEANCRVLGNAKHHLFKRLMRLTHQTMLTSGLHGMVVEDSYAVLKH